MDFFFVKLKVESYTLAETVACLQAIGMSTEGKVKKLQRRLTGIRETIVCVQYASRYVLRWELHDRFDRVRLDVPYCLRELQMCDQIAVGSKRELRKRFLTLLLNHYASGSMDDYEFPDL